MHHLFMLFGMVAIGVGAFALLNVHSDIQIGIGVSAIVGGLILAGQSILMSRTKP